MIAAVIALAIVVIGLVSYMIVEALAVAICGTIFYDVSFVDGWHAAWDHTGWLFVFALITLGTTVAKSPLPERNAR